MSDSRADLIKRLRDAAATEDSIFYPEKAQLLRQAADALQSVKVKPRIAVFIWTPLNESQRCYTPFGAYMVSPERSGSWYASFEDHTIGNGAENCEKAKERCVKDFERRVLECLMP